MDVDGAMRVVAPTRQGTDAVSGVETATRAPKFLRVWDFARARSAELCATTSAIEARTGTKLGVASLARHLRRRARSFAPRLTRHRPNLKRLRASAGGGTEAFRKARAAMRRQGVIGARRAEGRDTLAVRVLRTHVWHAKRCVARRSKRTATRLADDDEITHPANPRAFRRSLETRVSKLPFGTSTEAFEKD